MDSSRLKELKESKFLNQRFFKKISENMHYEIFKYITFGDLLVIRESSLGGFQLTSNKLLRSRIKNYSNFQPVLELKSTNTGEEGAKKLKLVFVQTGKEKVNLKGVKIKSSSLSEITKTFQFIPELKSLRLGDKWISPDEYYTLAHSFIYIPNLIKLKITQIFINQTIEKDSKLFENFKHLWNLQTLNLSGNIINGAHGLNFAENIKYLTSLQNLILVDCRIGSPAFRDLAINFKHLTKLQNLNLYGNNLDEYYPYSSGGGIAFQEYMSNLPQLRLLVLANNYLYEESVSNLAKSFKFLGALERLDISNINLQRASIQEIINNLEYLSNLLYLHYERNYCVSKRMLKSICIKKKLNIYHSDLL